MSGPKVRLGTKWLSITSQWTQSRAGSTTASASARWAKSAERMLGATIGGPSGGRPEPRDFADRIAVAAVRRGPVVARVLRVSRRRPTAGARRVALIG